MQFPLRSTRAVVFAVAIAAVFPSQVFAQKILVLAAEPVGAEAVQQRLKDANVFQQVDLIRVDLPGTTPPLSTLLQYDAVLTWSDAPYDAQDALGDVLSQYVDAGHGVVQAAFSLFNDPTLNLGGRWRTLTYDVFTYGDMASFPGSTLVALQPGHAILAGVTGMNGDVALGHIGLTVNNGQVIAEWTSHDPLVAARVGPQGGRVIGLNFYPVFADDANGTQLMVNALQFSTTPAEATNHAPTANAGANLTLEATGPLGASFTLTGTASDADGDPLTFSWSGAGLSGQALSLSAALLPPAGVKTGTYTLTLTVSDSHGASASDDVQVTVSDTTPPVLAHVPAAVVTADATSASGATVTYGPITATDAVDGVRPVTCSKSGTFPIGDTPVTCTASDTRGNVATTKFTVRVKDVTTSGTMWGEGTLRVGTVLNHVSFVVGERRHGQGAFLRLRLKNERYPHRDDDRFSSRSTSFVAFSDDPSIRPGAKRIDSVVFGGSGDWNGHAGYQYQMSVVDKGTPGCAKLTIRLAVTAPNGAVVARLEGALGGGSSVMSLLRR